MCTSTVAVAAAVAASAMPARTSPRVERCFSGDEVHAYEVRRPDGLVTVTMCRCSTSTSSADKNGCCPWRKTLRLFFFAASTVLRTALLFSASARTAS